MPGSWCAPQRPGPVTTSAVAGIECCFRFASSRWLRAVALHCATATLGMSSNVTATLKSRDWACATVLHARLRSKAFLIVSEYSPLYIAATRRRCFALSRRLFCHYHPDPHATRLSQVVQPFPRARHGAAGLRACG